jgi:cell division GTPase FtsZ
MKVVAVGIGQCGCNIADEFYAINNYARSYLHRNMEIVTDAFAINTDEADLTGLRFVPRDKHHRIIIGTMKTFGHGVGKINYEAALVMRGTHTSITDSILKSHKFHEADGIVVMASGGGGTGSGSIGWMIKGLKARTDKPVYAIVVLPFGFEEKGESSYAVTNTATSLKMVTQYSDAVFLLDNERFGRMDVSISQNFNDMNREMVKNFYDFFCAGEEKRQKYIGSKVIDAGDIKQSLSNISAIGRGGIDLSISRGRSEGFREGVRQGISAAGALSQAENNLSLRIDLKDARRILVLVNAPRDVLTLGLIQEIFTYLQEKSPEAVVRIGDYPHAGKEFTVSLIASELTKVPRLEEMYLLAEVHLKKGGEIRLETGQKIRQIYELSRNLPALE